MAVWEVLVLDSLTLTGDPTGTLSLEALDAPPPKARLDWIGAADSEGAALLRTPQHENREVTFRLRVAQQASMNLALDQVGAVVDKLRKATLTQDGVAMTWTPAGSTRTVTFDVLAGEIDNLPITWNGDDQGWFASRPVMNVRLTCKPYWRGTETLTSTASSATPFVTLEVAGVTGDVPALGRLIVTDAATQNRRHVEWGLENQYYNSALSLLLDSDNLVTSGFAGAQNTVTGAYDPNATGNNAISATVPQSLSAVCGTGNQSHIGVYRVKARVQTSADTQIRFSWRAGDGPLNSNSWTATNANLRWEEVDLGTITVMPVTAGTQRWTGQVEAVATSSTPTAVNVDYLVLVPVMEGYGKARAVPAQSQGVLVAYDEYTTTTAGANLSARVAPIGGTWATSGDATDLIFSDDFNGESVKRATVSDTATGRFAVLGATNYTDTQVESVVFFNQYPVFGTASFSQAVLGRYVDSSNFLMLRMEVLGSNVGSQLELSATVAGAKTILARATVSPGLLTAYRLRIIAYASGRVIGVMMPYSSQGDQPAVAVLDATDTRVATGGALQTGKPGFRDVNQNNVAITRWYDLFNVSTPPAEPVVLYSTRTMQFRWDATVRVDSTNTYYGRPSSYRGARFLVPPGTSRVLVKARRWDVEGGEDTPVTDNTTIQVGWTPRGLVVPR